MLFDVCVGVIDKVQATMNVGKIANAQAIARVQLGLEEVAASVADVGQLEQAGCD